MNVSEKLDELNKLAQEKRALESDAQRMKNIADELAKRRREWMTAGGPGSLGVDSPAMVRSRDQYRTWIDHELENELEKLFDEHLPALLMVLELKFRAKAKERQVAADLVRETIRAALVEG